VAAGIAALGGLCPGHTTLASHQTAALSGRLWPGSRRCIILICGLAGTCIAHACRIECVDWFPIKRRETDDKSRHLHAESIGALRSIAENGTMTSDTERLVE